MTSKMLYTVYRTTNIVNLKFYIGVHKTENLDDGYLGSGKILKRSVAKYGEKNFSKILLLVTNSPDEAFERERLEVDSARKDPLCMNLRCGGSGGFDFINNPERMDQSWRHSEAVINAGKRAVAERLAREKSDPEFAASQRALRLRNLQKGRDGGCQILANKRSSEVWTGKKHSPETRQKMSAAKRGKALSIKYAWVTDGTNIRRIPSSFLDQFIAEGWTRGKIRKVKTKRQPVEHAHGTKTKYRRGCRCALCVKSYNDYMRNYMRERYHRLRAPVTQVD